MGELVNQGIAKKETTSGLDAIIDCNTEDINQLIAELKKAQFTTSIKIDAVEGNLIQ